VERQHDSRSDRQPAVGFDAGAAFADVEDPDVEAAVLRLEAGARVDILARIFAQVRA
jgi:hypothetical protein